MQTLNLSFERSNSFSLSRIKVAWRIVPFLMLLYFVAFVDRVNIAFFVANECGYRAVERSSR